MELINYPRLESKLANSKVYRTASRPRKVMWEENILDSTLDEGLILEFGVASGGSIGWFAKHFKGSAIYGFDSFEGLPEDWNLGNTVLKKGHFTTKGKTPEVEGVTFVKGWFENTLPDFLEKHDSYLKIIHLDADLYSSTKYVLEQVKERLVPGTFILFDELTHFPNHPQYAHNRQHEYKAFMEFCQTYPSFDFDVVARTGVCHVLIQVTNGI